MSEIYTIDRIKTTKKGRYALFCGGDFLFSVDEESIVKYALEEGSELSSGELEAIRKASDYNRARDKAFSLLAVRDHGEKELYRKLQKDFDSHTCAATIARLKELGLMDDSKFAAQMTERYLAKGKSLSEIRAKLIDKGLDRETVDNALSGTEEDETGTIRDIIVSRYMRKLDQPGGYGKVFAALSRRGFRSSDIRKALDSFRGPEGEEYYE